MSSLVPTVYVVDDEPAVRKSLARLLRSAGLPVETFASAGEFIARHQADVPGCLVLDVTMPGISGLELQQWLARSNAPLPIIFITGHGDVPTSVRAMKAGALDFLMKPLDEQELLVAIRAALRHDKAQRAAQADITAARQRLARLTARERQVLEHVISGRLNKQIAAELGTVEQTVKVHRARVMEKMGVDSVAALVRLSQRAGIEPVAPQRSKDANQQARGQTVLAL